MNKIIIVGGPTASGKTKLALEVADIVNGEIINADSMQVYKGMDIGTNKGDLHVADYIEPKQIKLSSKVFNINPYFIENSTVIGWLFNIVDPDDNFTVREYQQLANYMIEDIRKRGKTPVLVGGTGLYIDSVLRQYNIKGVPDESLRSKLSRLTVNDLQTYLEGMGFDLDTLNNSDRNNPRRLIRIIEKINSQEELEKNNKNFEIEHIFLYPKFNFTQLESKIAKRVEIMIRSGFIEEVKNLLEKGYDSQNKAMQSTGYREVTEYIKGSIKTESELIRRITLSHRQYAKRQVTWFEGKPRGYSLIKISPGNKEKLKAVLK